MYKTIDEAMKACDAYCDAHGIDRYKEGDDIGDDNVMRKFAEYINQQKKFLFIYQYGKNAWNDFESLCDNHGLPFNGYYLALFELFAKNRAGKFYTLWEMIRDDDYDDSVFVIARVLRQLSHCGRGVFSVVVGSEETYESVAGVEAIKQALTEALQSRVKKEKGNMIVTGIGYNLSVFSPKELPIPYPLNCSPEENGFSNAEIDMIIKAGNKIKARAKKMRGNVVKSVHTRNAEIGELVFYLKQWLPEKWIKAKKNAFFVEYLDKAGFLDFKGKDWLKNFRYIMSEKDKNKEIENFVNSYYAAIGEK